MPRRTLAAAILFTTLAGACVTGGPASSPRATLTALHAAAARGDAAALYALLPEQARREEPFARFAARLREEQAELRELGTRVRTALDQRASAHAEVSVRAGVTVTVVDDREGWRVGAPGFGPTVATLSPEAAALALRSALLRLSLADLLRVLAPGARGAIQAEIAALTDALADPAALRRVYTTGDPTSVHFDLPDGRRLFLRRDGSDPNWRVVDVR